MKEIWRKYEEMPSSRGGAEKFYADRIPEMAPSTKREGGSPAKIPRETRRQDSKDMKSNLYILAWHREIER